MKPFDLLNAPLTGTHLIEASAGTGKTYAIEGIFVRLVLEQHIPPSKILVVTFTRSATDELKERIYRKLVDMRRAFAGQISHDDAVIAGLRDRYPEPERGIRLLQEAVSEFDRAAIFTIHGFCQRILRENAFETGQLFDTELTEDQSQLVRRIARDFWRSHLYPAEPEIGAYISGRLRKGPDALLGLLQTCVDDRIQVFPKFDRRPEVSSLDAVRRAAEALKSRWPQDRAAVQTAFFDQGLSGSVFGSLKPDPRAGGISRRARRVASLMAAMDELAGVGLIVPPLFKDFAKFTTTGLARATRKGQQAPQHDFFQLCDSLASAVSEFSQELDGYLTWLKSRAVESFRTELPKRKNALNIQYFDDLLTRVKQALETSDAKVLEDAVRRRYQAALVDEFQDTDSIQYDIFTHLFARRGTPLFLIGDPKQSIYGFRGADIFTYMQAARHSPQRHTLRENWRSAPGLITAVNAIFSGAPIPFVYAAIGFEPGLSAGRHPGQVGIPMTIWYLDSRQHGQNGLPVPKYVAEPLIITAVGAEITRLLSAPDLPVVAGDIAVLVRTNRQARLVKDGLTRQGIPAVLHSTGNIFDTAEADELEALIGCIANPTNTRRLKAAMVTQLWGKTASELLAFDTDSQDWQGLQQRAQDYRRIWQKDGFMRMFRLLLAQEDIAVRLMGLPDGERRLTNLLHLGELLHRSAVEMNLTPSALVNWLTEQRNSDAPRTEAHQLRLESDADAVRIVTIHKSKGLEYPVVFCPFNWEDSRVRGTELRFHDPGHDHRPVLHLNARPDDHCRQWAQNEQLSENLRLLYVALTRAKTKCYLVWGRIRSADTSALAYLLHARIGRDGQLDNTDAVALLSDSMAGRTDADYLADLNELAACNADCLAITPLPVEAPAHLSPPANDVRPTSRHFCATIDRTRSIISFSTLVARRHADVDLPDHDELLNRWRPVLPADATESEIHLTSERPDRFAFARGAQAGIFFHDLLEQMDFALGARESRAVLVREKLTEHGFETRWQAGVTDLLQQVLETPLSGQAAAFCFGQIEPQDRLHELEFYFPLNKLTPDRLVRRLQPHFKQPDRAAALERIKELSFSPARGFMKGFIDMVFAHQGKYYLVDWKSNHLGDAREEYHCDRLQAVMDAHLYGLQALIYTLALDQYLRTRLPDYRYETHFGGAYYVFLRGIHKDWGPQYGVHASRLDPVSVRTLRDQLIPVSAGEPPLDG